MSCLPVQVYVYNIFIRVCPAGQFQRQKSCKSLNDVLPEKA